MAPLYSTLLFLALVSQFKPSMSPVVLSYFKYIHLLLHEALANDYAQLQRRQAVNATCAPYCTPEIVDLVRPLLSIHTLSLLH
jgi:hypothetical protein